MELVLVEVEAAVLLLLGRGESSSLVSLLTTVEDVPRCFPEKIVVYNY